MLGCIAAIVSAFQSGADLFQSIRDRSSKRRRMKESDWERAVEEKMLHRSLINSAVQCQAVSGEKCRQFGDDFVRGDAVAMSELKNVMIALQTDVISALQIGRAVPNATLDLLALHEAVVVVKANALRAMQDFCQRIMSTAPIQQHADLQSPARPSRRMSRQSLTGGSDKSQRPSQSMNVSEICIPQAVSIPAPGIPERSPARMLSRLQLTDAFPKRSLTMSLKRRSSAWFPQIKRLHDDAADDDHDDATVFDEHQTTGTNETVNRTSVHDSAVGSSVANSRHHHSTSFESSTFDLAEERRVSCATADSFEYPEDFYTTPQATYSPAKEKSPRELAPSPSTSNPSRFMTLPQMSSLSPTNGESPDDVLRASRVAVAATTYVEAEPVHASRRTPRWQPSSPSSVTSMQNIHPAFRSPWTGGAPVTQAPEIDQLWAPHARAAKFNDNHHFCKGAWQARARLEDGLSIQLLSTPQGQVAPFWKCKQCAFRSNAMDGSNILPGDIQSSPCGVRYRWLFLAKSHVHAETTQPRPEDYAYGCIFCAAQGSETSVCIGLESLMSHLVAKHKTSMLTPDVLEKTKCVVGGAPGKGQDWDVNLPQSHRRTLRGKVGEFMASAFTGMK